MSSEEFGDRVLGAGFKNILSQLTSLSRLCLVGHVLLMANTALPCRVLFFVPRTE